MRLVSTGRSYPATVVGTDPSHDVAVIKIYGSHAERLSGLIETSAPVQPGWSGGPLLNLDGEVIGIDTAASAGRRFQSSTGAGLAIPINQALAIADRLCQSA